MNIIKYVTLVVFAFGVSSCTLLHQTKPVKHSQLQGTYLGAGAGFGTGLAATGTVPIPLGVAIGSAFGLTTGTHKSSIKGLSKMLTKEGAQVVTVGDRVTVYLPTDLIFKRTSDKIKETAYPMLSHIAAMALLFEKQGKITVTGNTDNVMSNQLNQQLSSRQAHSVRAYLWAEGIKREAIQARGVGSKQPIANNQTVMGSAANRNVTVVFEKS